MGPDLPKALEAMGAVKIFLDPYRRWIHSLALFGSYAFAGDRCQALTFDITESIDQTKAQANWLSKWLSSAVGDPVKVSPMVTIPGWYVERKSPNGVAVLNPKQVKAYLDAKREEVLSDSMIKRICHQLEQKCRDVDLWKWY
jgi:hypothetical protein